MVINNIISERMVGDHEKSWKTVEDLQRLWKIAKYGEDPGRFREIV